MNSNNPRGGTSRITNVDNNGISYVRGNSTIYVSSGDLYSAYDRFKGARVSSTDLRGSHPRYLILRRDQPGTHAIAPFFPAAAEDRSRRSFGGSRGSWESLFGSVDAAAWCHLSLSYAANKPQPCPVKLEGKQVQNKISDGSTHWLVLVSRQHLTNACR
jgi:hypothetical protein